MCFNAEIGILKTVRIVVLTKRSLSALLKAVSQLTAEGFLLRDFETELSYVAFHKGLRNNNEERLGTRGGTFLIGTSSGGTPL